MPDTAVPLSLAAVVSVAIASVLIPAINAFLTSDAAPAWVKSSITTVLAGLTAVATYLVDIKGVPDWKHALSIGIAAIVGAAGYRKSISPDYEPALHGTGLQLGGSSFSPGQGHKVGKPEAPAVEVVEPSPVPPAASAADKPDLHNLPPDF